MKSNFESLLSFLQKLPAIENEPIGSGNFENGNWWVKFRINTNHELAWRHIQELGHVLNYISINEPLPTAFMPVSPPPYMNGGEEFLSWVIESKEPDFTPDLCAEWLEGRLPNPVEDNNEWLIESDE